MSKIRPPVKWYGGKYYLAPWIVSHFPAHRIYLEPFGGGASVLLNKKRVDVEVYNDIDYQIVRLFWTLRNNGEEFIRKARLIPYSQSEFNDAANPPDNPTELDFALCDFVRWRQSFAGQGKSWSYTTKRARGGCAGDVNGWLTAIEGLHDVVERLRRVQILNMPAINAIEKFDDAEALIYCDPPYLHETRGQSATSIYQHEMSEHEHFALSEVLRACRATIIVSGYDSELYQQLYSGWRVEKKEIANHASGGASKTRETECLWINRSA
jgi:DNA adenine methylase